MQLWPLAVAPFVVKVLVRATSPYAQSAERRLTILAPFIDDEGAEFLVQLFAACRRGIDRRLVCRPLAEDQCGLAFRKRKADFHRLAVIVSGKPHVRVRVRIMKPS